MNEKDKNSKNEHEIFLDLMITGTSMTTEEISDMLMVQPTKLYKIGDQKFKHNPNMKHKKNGWIFRVKSDGNLSFCDLINKIVEIIEINKIQLREISKKMDVKIFCAIYRNLSWPDMILSSDSMRSISDINATIEFDIYC